MELANARQGNDRPRMHGLPVEGTLWASCLLKRQPSLHRACHYAYGIDRMYVFSMPGQKIDWLRSNPHACLQMEEHSDHGLWKSVLVQGQYHELPDTSQHHNERIHAWDLLQE